MPVHYNERLKHEADAREVRTRLLNDEQKQN